MIALMPRPSPDTKPGGHVITAAAHRRCGAPPTAPEKFVPLARAAAGAATTASSVPGAAGGGSRGRVSQSRSWVPPGLQPWNNACAALACNITLSSQLSFWNTQNGRSVSKLWDGLQLLARMLAGPAAEPLASQAMGAKRGHPHACCQQWGSPSVLARLPIQLQIIWVLCSTPRRPKCRGCTAAAHQTPRDWRAARAAGPRLQGGAGEGVAR